MGNSVKWLAVALSGIGFTATTLRGQADLAPGNTLPAVLARGQSRDYRLQLRAGEYALTRLADALAEFFLQEETLTRESLALLTHTLTAQLTDVRNAAKKARTFDEWRQKVSQPLRITAGDQNVAVVKQRSRVARARCAHV